MKLWSKGCVLRMLYLAGSTTLIVAVCGLISARGLTSNISHMFIATCYTLIILQDTYRNAEDSPHLCLPVIICCFSIVL